MKRPKFKRTLINPPMTDHFDKVTNNRIFAEFSNYIFKLFSNDEF